MRRVYTSGDLHKDTLEGEFWTDDGQHGASRVGESETLGIGIRQPDPSVPADETISIGGVSDACTHLGAAQLMATPGRAREEGGATTDSGGRPLGRDIG
jgi:hypothetical protein